MIRRLAVIGDIHAEHERLEQSLERAAEWGADGILAVGDIVDGPGDAARCCELLATHGVDVVRGNHDRWYLRDVAGSTAEEHAESVTSFLRDLPPTRSYDTVRGRLLLCHGLGADDMNRLIPEDDGYALQVNNGLHELIMEKEYQIVVGGHTHRRMVRHFGEMVVINAGTLLREHAPCLTLLDLEQGLVSFVDFDEGGVLDAAGQTTRIWPNES